MSIIDDMQAKLAKLDKVNSRVTDGPTHSSDGLHLYNNRALIKLFELN
jgi:hypothetical protein